MLEKVKTSFPRNYWKNEANQRKFLDGIAKQLQIKQPSEWGKVTYAKMIESGGKSLLSHYNQSLFKALQKVYPHIKWDISWFHKPMNFWDSVKNQREFMDKFAKKHGIKSQQDWANVNIKLVATSGGGNILTRYGHSLYEALKTIYSEIKWDSSLFRKNHKQGYWNSEENQREFLNNISPILKVKSLSDWTNITVREVRSYGGHGLLYKYGYSLYKALVKIHSHLLWNRSMFKNLIRFGEEHWSKLENQRKFLDGVAKDLDLKTESDWRKVSSNYLKYRGGAPLLKIYNQSILSALETIYKEKDWTNYNYSIGSSKPQSGLSSLLQNWMPEIPILLNYRHPKMTHITSEFNVELDVYIPDFKLAFEYHGMQHYKQFFMDKIEEQKRRDEYRRQKCKQMGITLIEIPYWWNKNEGIYDLNYLLYVSGQLYATLKQIRPDLLPYLNISKENVVKFEKSTPIITSI